MMDSRHEAKVTMPKRKRRSDDGDLDITPMIDITFLLLAFFIVVSKMDPASQVSMPIAKHGATVPEQVSVIIIVVPSESDEPTVFLGRAKTENDKATGSIEDIERQIADYVMSEFRQDPKKTTVIIKAERKVKYRHLDIVKRAVSTELTEDQVINVGIEEE